MCGCGCDDWLSRESFREDSWEFGREEVNPSMLDCCLACCDCWTVYSSQLLPWPLETDKGFILLTWPVFERVA